MFFLCLRERGPPKNANLLHFLVDGYGMLWIQRGTVMLCHVALLSAQDPANRANDVSRLKHQRRGGWFNRLSLIGFFHFLSADKLTYTFQDCLNPVHKVDHINTSSDKFQNCSCFVLQFLQSPASSATSTSSGAGATAKTPGPTQGEPLLRVASTFLTST